jgi:hypothetical protein
MFSALLELPSSRVLLRFLSHLFVMFMHFEKKKKLKHCYYSCRRLIGCCLQPRQVRTFRWVALPAWRVSWTFTFPGCCSDAYCCLPLPWFRRTSLWSIWAQLAASSVHTDLQCWPYFFYGRISQSLLAVNVARHFGCFTASTAGSSDSPRWRHHFLSSVTDLPLKIFLLL